MAAGFVSFSSLPDALARRLAIKTQVAHEIAGVMMCSLITNNFHHSRPEALAVG